MTQNTNFIKWLIKQYIENVNIDGIEKGVQFEQLVSKFLNMDENSFQALSGLRVFKRFNRLKYRYPLGTEGYVCGVIHAYLGDMHTHYGYVYWRRGQESKEPEYICIGPTFNSRDGEYRKHFMRMSDYNKLITSYGVRYDAIESIVVNMIKSRELKLEMVLYPSGNDIHNRLPIQAFTIALILQGSSVYNNSMMIHTNEAYVKIIRAIATKYPILREIYKISNDIILSTSECGQKFTPMYLRESMQLFDYNLATWRELVITRAVSDLVINFISQNFAIFNQWTYVEDTDEDFFENKLSKEKYTRSETASEVTESLREARHILGEMPNTAYHTDELSAYVYENIEYAQSYITLSPVSFMYSIEYVGRTFGSIPNIVRNRTECAHFLNTFTNSIHTTRIFFELVYALYCLHTKIGVVHSDIHENNITIHAWQKDTKANSINPITAYITGPKGEADTYIFPAMGNSANIIDYSRCIIGPSFRLRLESEHTERYATNFYRDQVNRVMKILHRYSPDYVVKNQDIIKASIIAKFELIYPVLCLVDYISLGATMSSFLTKLATPMAGEIREFKIPDGSMDFANRLESLGRELFITGLHNIVESKLDDISKNPGTLIFGRMFAQWSFPQWSAREPASLQTAEIVNVYNYNNEMKYSGSDYSKYPPWARIENIEKNRGSYSINDITGRSENNIDTFMNSMGSNIRPIIIADQLRTREEKLDGKGIDTTGSWIND